MKIQPIEFAYVFEGSPYFDPHIEASGLQLYNRAIVLTGFCSYEPIRYWIKFRIVDNYRRNSILISKSITDTFCANLERDSQCFRADQSTKYREHICNLASGDLRGRIAENTAELLFRDLYGRSKAVKKWIPLMYEQLTEFYRK